MEPVSSVGSLSAIGDAMVNVGTTTKSFILAHSVGLAVTGGVVLGLGTYFVVRKLFSKKKTAEPVMAAA